MRYVLLLCMGFTAMAQQNPITPPTIPPIRQPWQQLTRYLELTPDQQTGLLRLQAEWQRYLIEKQRRVGDVERELSQETNAKAPDPLSLGLRYAELEAICREARDKDNQNMQSARKLLTAAQTAKLQTLESVYAMLPVVNEASQANLLRAPELNRAAFPIMIGGVVAVDNPVVQGYPGCRQTTIMGQYAPVVPTDRTEQ